MNANELADKLEDVGMEQKHYDTIQKAATMLRQQQALINQREDEIKAFYNLVTEQDKKIIDLAFKLAYAERSNEVVKEAKTLTDEYCKAYWGKDNCFVDVFLPNSETEVIRFWNDQLNESYESKTLTDEEIAELSDKILCYQIYDNKESGVFEFARAILRKASEK